MEEETFGELELEESNFRSLKRVKAGIDTLVCKNEAGLAVNGDEIADWLASVSGIGAITSLVIAPSSRLPDLSIVRGLPNLVNVQVNGSRLQSLDGLASFRKGRYLNIDTGKNRRRNIAHLADAPITKLSLQYASPQDFDAIARSSTMNHLELGGSPQPPLERWARVPLSILALSKGTFKELANTAAIPTLKKVVLTSCRQLEALTGNHDHVTWLAIQGCGRLRLDTASRFTNVESLFIVGVQNKLALSALGPLRRLQTLSIENCKLDLDGTELGTSMPRLESLYLAGLAELQALRLSQANPGIEISTGRVTFKNGVAARGSA